MGKLFLMFVICLIDSCRIGTGHTSTDNTTNATKQSTDGSTNRGAETTITEESHCLLSIITCTGYET